MLILSKKLGGEEIILNKNQTENWENLSGKTLRIIEEEKLKGD